jgi:hypothetical protein
MHTSHMLGLVAQDVNKERQGGLEFRAWGLNSMDLADRRSTSVIEPT